MTTEPTIRETELPVALGDRFETVLDAEEPPATYGEWAATTATVLQEADIFFDVEALCTTDESPHRATFGDGEVQYFRCVLDTLLVPLVLDDAEPVAVETKCPVTGEAVELRVTREGVIATPDDAVVSFGIDAEPGEPADLDRHPLQAYGQFCPYINAFADRAAYDEWAGATSEAVTTPLSVVEAFELAELLVDEVTED